ncbi:splicing regulatory glutamine/lysine-rich protein 1-like [Cardiocondyla obscurior]
MEDYLKRKRVEGEQEEESELTRIRKEIKTIDKRGGKEQKGSIEGEILKMIREMREEMKRGIEKLKDDNRGVKKKLEMMRKKEEEEDRERSNKGKIDRIKEEGEERNERARKRGIKWKSGRK